MSNAFMQRIMGIETEYGVSFRPSSRGERVLGPDEVARHLYLPLKERFSSTNIFIRNGGRLYLDVGDHPEYATPECTGLTQLIDYHLAGDTIVSDLARWSEKRLAEVGHPGSIYLFKNNVDSFGNSYGAHENYLVSRHTSLPTLSKRLLPFLITRQILCGAGMIYKPLPKHLISSMNAGARNYSPGFCLSQRADHVWESVSSATTRSRPMINTRDEPHADSSLYRRLHVIVGDASIAEPTLALKIGSTLLVLELIEAGLELPPVELANASTAIREIAHVERPGIEPEIPLADGTSTTACALQRVYLDTAEAWLAQRDDADAGVSNEEMARVVELWRRCIEACEEQDFSAVDRDIDWVIKRSLLDDYRASRDLAADDPRLVQLDLMYHDIHPQRGLGLVLQQKGRINRWTTSDAVDHATHTAPSTTRAKIRGDFLSTAYDRRCPVTSDWMRIKVTRPEPQFFDVVDPFATQSDDVDGLIRYIEDNYAEVLSSPCSDDGEATQFAPRWM